MGLTTLLFMLPLAAAWPDGAPCVPTTFESMNPLEAVEHQGGLMLSEPPYEIETEQSCYWRGQPIAFTLQGKNESVWFKGFAVQPLEYNNGDNGKRVGRLLRLDDNGSWQYQCFRFKDQATHSHNQRKKHMKIWWRNDDDESRTVQFVATVVHSQKRFWVKSVLSRPIPPCRQQREFGPYTPPMPSPPPGVKTFKMEADREFGNFFINEAIPAEKGDGFPPTSNNNPSPSFAANFQQQQEQERQREIERARSDQRRREMERDRLQRERERALAEQQREDRERQRNEENEARQRAETERRARIQADRARVEQEQRQRADQQRAQQLQRQQEQQQQRQQQQQQAQPVRQRNQGSFRPATATTFAVQQPQTVATMAPRQPFISSNNGVCADIDPPSRCIPWSQYCQASTYMHQYCRRTCHFC